MKLVKVYDIHGIKELYGVDVSEHEARWLIKARAAKVISEDRNWVNIKLTVETIGEARQMIKRYRQEQKVEGRLHVGECWACGCTIERIGLSQRFYCLKCGEQKEKDDAKKTALYDRLRYEQLVERAMVILERQRKPIYLKDYRRAYQSVLEYENGVKVFDSAHEVAAYMELFRCSVKVLPNFTIRRYRADFSLPDEKIVLEIDGHLHKNKITQDAQRDKDIRTELGPEWEVVRIPTEYVEQNIQQLLPAVRKMKEEMQKLRRLNDGELPEYFSQRHQKRRR